MECNKAVYIGERDQVPTPSIAFIVLVSTVQIIVSAASVVSNSKLCHKNRPHYSHLAVSFLEKKKIASARNSAVRNVVARRRLEHHDGRDGLEGVGSCGGNGGGGGEGLTASSGGLVGSQDSSR